MSAFGRLPGMPPPPLRPAANPVWYAVAAGLGAIAYALIVYRFQTYSQRNNTPDTTYELFALAMFACGFVLTMATRTTALRISGFLIAGVFAAHTVVIVMDTQQDPTNHNLAPFEYILFLVVSSPAFLGAWLGQFSRKTP